MLHTASDYLLTLAVRWHRCKMLLVWKDTSAKWHLCE